MSVAVIVSVTGGVASPVAMSSIIAGAQGPPGTPGVNARSLDSFGAVGNGLSGATNDDNAITAAIAWLNTLAAAGVTGTILLSGGKFYTTALGFKAPAGSSWIGTGDNCGFKVTGNVTTFAVGGQLVAAKNFRIIGTGSGANQHGVVNYDGTNGYERFTCVNVTVESVGGYAFWDTSYSALSGLYGIGAFYEGITALNCGLVGWRSNSAEYSILSGARIRGCTKGIELYSGNVTLDGCMVDGNGTNLYLGAGGNDSHGMATGCHFNHATAHNFVAEAIANGWTFSACHFYDSAVDLVSTASSASITFSACTVDVAAITDAGNCFRFLGCMWPSAFSNTITGNPYFDGSNVKVSDGSVPSFLKARLDRGFSPSERAQSLLVWYRGDYVTLNAGNVSQLTDLSWQGDSNRNAVQATAGHQPNYTAVDANYNNKPTLNISSSSGRYLASGTFGTTYSQPYTVYLVGQMSDGRLIDGVSGGNRVSILDNSGKWSGFGGAAVIGATVADTTPAVVCAVFNGANFALYVNNSQTASDTGNIGAGQLSAIGVFALTDGTGGGTSGTLAEMLIVSGADGPLQRQQMMFYLAQRYGIASVS